MTLKIKTNALDAISNVKHSEDVKNALTRLDTDDTLPDVMKREDVKKEIKRLLIKEGITLEYIITKYKELLSKQVKHVRAGDILKALERVESLHGIKKDQHVPDVPDVIVALQSKDDQEVKTFITRITARTQEYITRLERVEDVKK